MAALPTPLVLPAATPTTHLTVIDQDPSLSPHSHVALTLLDGDFDTLSQELIAALLVDEQESRLEDNLEPPVSKEPSQPQLHPNALVFPTSPTVQLLAQSQHPVTPVTHTTQKTNIPLSQLFIYCKDSHTSQGHAIGIPSTARIDFFWADGVRELVHKAQLHDTLEASSEQSAHA